jgi:cellulose synthase (UDP-forming)
MQAAFSPGTPPQRISATERILTWALVFLGFESVLYFGVWWFDPAHRVHLVFYLPLTFATFWLMYEAGMYWFYLLAMKLPERRTPKAGIEVDVFTTAAPGEPMEMFERSLPALAAMSYPHTTYLLDGSDTPGMEEMAKRFGVRRIDCTGVGGAKAGKINHGLSQTTGEIVLVIDPDHIPQAHFLETVLGNFDDPEVGFVQVAQAYYNQPSSFVARAAAEQTYGFYGPVLTGMHGCGAALVIGANCTFRRAALESIGGHAVDLVEDFVTSLRLHARGWKSVYIPEIVARGLVPEDLHSYFGQQLKWATGMFRVLFTMIPRLLFRLKGWQKFCYLLSSTYYFVGLPIAINLILPVVFLLFGLWAVEMPIRGYAFHLIPFAVMFLTIHRYSQRWMCAPEERGWQWRGMLLKVGTWPIYLLALIFALTGVEVPYLPTAKRRQEGIFPVLVAPHMLIVLCSVGAIIWGLRSPLSGYYGTKLMELLAGINVFLMSPTIAAAFSGRPGKGAESR